MSRIPGGDTLEVRMVADAFRSLVAELVKISEGAPDGASIEASLVRLVKTVDDLPYLDANDVLGFGAAMYCYKLAYAIAVTLKPGFDQRDLSAVVERANQAIDLAYGDAW
jgi:hypothetical protein